MTPAQALGKLIVSYFDGRRLEGMDRALVMEAIPPQLRFVDSSGNIACIATIDMLFSYLHKQKAHPKPPLAPYVPWTEDELDSYEG